MACTEGCDEPDDFDGRRRYDEEDCDESGNFEDVNKGRQKQQVKVARMSQEQVKTTLRQCDYISKTTLLKYRNVKWTEKAISMFLGESDKEGNNPYYRFGGKMKLYSVKRVEAVEQSKEFKEFVNNKLTSSKS